jgi:hypothetical protein
MNTPFETHAEMSSRPPGSTPAGIETVNVATAEQHAVSRCDEWDEPSRSALTFEVVRGIHREHSHAVPEAPADPAVAAFASNRQAFVHEAFTAAHYVENGPTADMDPATDSDRASSDSELGVAIRVVTAVSWLCTGHPGERKQEHAHYELLHDTFLLSMN